MAQCPKCGSPKLTERPCPRCGYGTAAVISAGRAHGDPIAVNMPDDLPLTGTLGFDSADEIEPAFNMRDWVRDAMEAKGAKMVGGGIGCGQADIDIELEGHCYNISIRARKRA